MTHLRRISVHVDEPDPGTFYWVLMEEGDDASQWVEHSSSPHPYKRWRQALTDGCLALMAIAEDDRHGPRTSAEDEDASPVGTPVSQASMRPGQPPGEHLRDVGY